MAIKKTKILFIHHSAGWGGAPINMINIINKLDRTKFEPHVLLLKDSVVKDRFRENNIAVTICNSNFYKKRYKYLSHSDAGFIKPYRVYKLLKMFVSWFMSKYIYAPLVLKEFEFDIVHLNSSVLSDWIYPASKKGKVIYHIREPISKGIFRFRYNFIRSEVQKYADKIIAISKDNAKRINIPQKTEVVYNFIDIPNKIKETNSAKSLLYVGGASKIKGIEILIEAIPMINRDIQISMVGHFPKLQILSKLKKIAYKLLFPKAYELRTKLKTISEYENVNIIGSVSSITNILQESNLLVSPFTVPHFSRPVVEAFAYKKPVIVSNVLGMDEIVDDNINGLIIEKNNPKALAEAINYLCSHLEKAREMGLKGREKAEKVFAPEINTRKVENIYQQLINK
jgi:glycosyltransferase involved in cell wall biosynthesis